MRLMVLDGNSIVNRAFYGVRSLTTKEGMPTNAIFGFLNILTKLVADEEPDGLCVTFDLKAPTFRHKMYDGYKAQRKPMPEELAVQIPILKDVLDAMNIPRYEKEGYEADDLIGTISAKCESAGWDCVIVTGDKDSFQLITDRTVVKHVKSRMGRTETKTYDKAAFAEEYGFEPKKMIDLKALMGDASDNIPGVAGVGEKTAMSLVREYGTVEDIYKRLDEIKESVKKKLEAGIDSAKMSFELATINCCVPMEFVPEDNGRRPVDNDRLYPIFKDLEFTKLTEKMGLVPPEDNEVREEVFEGECVSLNVTSEAEVRGLLSDISSKECVFVRVSEKLNITVVENNGKSDSKAYILRRGVTENYEDALSKIFSGDIKKAGHNIKDTMRQLAENGYGCEGWVFDTALCAYLLDPVAQSYELGELTKKYCGFVMSLPGEQDGQLSLLDNPDEAVGMIIEAASVGAVMEVIQPKLKELGMEKLYYEIELPLCRVLADMEKEGFFVDRNALCKYGDMLQTMADGVQTQIFQYAGEEFNINSPKQLGEVLFDRMMLPAPKRTKTGYSTNIDVLEKLKSKHPIIGLIIEYRQLTKLKSTYADGLVKVIAPDGRIHTNFQMTVTATGRLSSTEPNLQNIPVRRELGEEIRKMFAAGEGKVLVDADYSQIELRLLAHISDDENMKKAFLCGTDIHTATASQVFEIPEDEVSPLLRSRAKAVNFGIVYGISPFSLAQDIGVSVAEAKQYMNSYLSKYHGVAEYMSRIVRQAKADGYVSTLFGRRRYLPELKASNYNVRSFGERVALNMPIQGTAADVMKIAMINVHRRLRAEGLEAKLILQVHDELIVECPESEGERVKNILCEEMERSADFSVPLTADGGIGKTWYEAK